MKLAWLLVLLPTALGRIVSRDSASSTCKHLEATYPDLTFFPLSPGYIKANTDFYTSSAWLGPACVFQPTDSRHLADAVLLLKNTSTPFAIRGGGHMPIANAANINSSGVLLSSFGLSQLKVSDDHSTVHVGPGNRWADVYKYLEPYGLSVVGGRLGVVGVPGYILGGGVAFFSNEYGWASANVVRFTGVLADGRVVTAKPNNEHADLFWALRGGGNSFALATDFELKTLRVPKVTVGMANYGFGVGEQFIRSVHDFATAGTKDPKAAVIPMAEYLPETGTVSYSAILFYNGNNATPAALQSFQKPTLTPLTNTFRYRSMNQWSQELDGAVGLLKGSRQRFYVLNIHASRKETIATVHDTFVEVAKTSLPIGVVVAAMAFPQVAEQYIHASTVNGGDPQDLDPDGAPYIWVEESITALAAVRDEDIDAFYTKVNGEIRQKLLADGVKLPEYTYLNDANPAQDSFGTFPPDNLARLRKIRARYDPDRVFTDLMPGGWKVS
ncbi:FAD dependent oxidoreductase [Penicillium alfredii]|uniref:FAD dependent oxidoreductase n=1 Tax=Penicillium alfredii TaxID=1506179 RepID=A0A9W9F2Y4_9EURO|nr:FAD dependent oxidoreductase [Penicillium alfredii]KAJ5092637.1 FAD dependent oxidoreductase [Penicillium alfredii]